MLWSLWVDGHKPFLTLKSKPRVSAWTSLLVWEEICGLTESHPSLPHGALSWEREGFCAGFSDEFSFAFWVLSVPITLYQFSRKGTELLQVHVVVRWPPCEGGVLLLQPSEVSPCVGLLLHLASFAY